MRMTARLIPIAGFAALAFCLSGFLAGCSPPASEQASVAPSEAPSPVSPAPVDPANIKAAEASFRAEPKVRDLVYEPAAVVQWTIAVNDDGSSRIGYADYFCNRLQQLGIDASSTKVRIVDHRRFLAPGGNGRDANLGTVDCATGQPFQ